MNNLVVKYNFNKVFVYKDKKKVFKEFNCK